MTIGGVVLRFQPSIFSGSSAGSTSCITKARRVLSGAHWMSLSPPGTSLTFCASPPRRGSSHSCAPFFFSSSGPRSERNARYLPSGLHRGEVSLSGELVNCCCAVPSQRAIQTSVFRVSFAASMVVTV